MADNDRLFRIGSQTSLIQLIASFLVIIISGIPIFFLLILIGSLIFHSSPSDMMLFPSPDIGTRDTIILRYVQVSQQIAIFLIPSLIVSKMLKSDNVTFLKTDKFPGILILFLVVLLAMLIIPVNAYAGLLNSRMDLPDSFSGIENWMKIKEREASELTVLLVTSSSMLTLSVNLVIMALIPAVSEEFIFRGILQQVFGRFLRSSNAGIWVTAILFSGIHFQFYGFVPRLILGLIFGYLFYWTGNLWIAVIAHFINNASLVIISFFTGFRTIEEDIANGQEHNSYFPFIPAILCCLILYYLWNEFRKVKSAERTEKWD